MVGRQLRLILHAQESKKAGCSQEETAKEIGYRYAAKLIQQARNFPLEQISGKFNYLLKADLDIKTGRMPASGVLEILITRLCR